MAPRLKCLPPGLATIDTRIASPPPKRVDPFYVSKPWRELMRQLVTARGDACQQCGRSGVRLFGDHIHELTDGGSQLDPTNIRLLCGSCHTKKTAKVRASRMKERYGR